MIQKNPPPVPVAAIAPEPPATPGEWPTPLALGIVSCARAVIWCVLAIWLMFLLASSPYEAARTGVIITPGATMSVSLSVAIRSAPAYILARALDKILLALLGR